MKKEDSFLFELDELLLEEERLRTMSDKEPEEQELTDEDFGDSEPDDAVDADDEPKEEE